MQLSKPVTFRRTLLRFFGEESLTPDLIESFKLYVSQDGQEVKDKSFGVDLDFSEGDLLDLFSNFKC